MLVLMAAMMASSLAGDASAQPPPEHRPAQPTAAADAERDQPAPDVPVFHTEIVVTPGRGPDLRAEVPAAHAVLTETQISTLPSENLAELLDHLPGFHVLFGAPFGGAPIVMSRGFLGAGEAEYVQLLIDGVPMADAESGLADWRRVRALALTRVEALRGPGSSLYGDTALGGVVQVFTRRVEGALAGASWGSFGSGAVDGAYGRIAGRIGLTLTGGGWRTTGFRAHAGSAEGDLSIALDGAAAGGTWRFATAIGVQDRDEPGPLTGAELGRPRAGSNPLFRFDRAETTKGSAAFRYARSGRLDYSGRLHAAGRGASVVRTLLMAPEVGVRADRRIDTASLGGAFDIARGFAVGGRRTETRAGLEATGERLETEYSASLADGGAGPSLAAVRGSRFRAGAFVSQRWYPIDRLHVSSGVRWDRVEDRFGAGQSGGRSEAAWSPRLGATLLVRSTDRGRLSIFGQVSRAFKDATLDQLFDPRPFPDFRGGTFTVSNRRLRPQRATNVEAGVNYAAGRHRVEVVGYQARVRDEIDFDIATFSYGNIGRSRHLGVELDAVLWAGGAVSPSFSYAWTYVTPLEGAYRTNQLKNIPRHLWRPAVTAALPLGLHAHVAYRRASGRYLDDENEMPLADMGVLDARISRTFGRTRVRLDLLNTADAAYEEYGFALADFLGRRTGYYFPGAGRAARLGVDLRF